MIDELWLILQRIFLSREKGRCVTMEPPLSQNYGHLGRCKKVGSKVIISMNCNNFPHHNFFQIGTFNHQKYKKQNNCDPPLKPLCVQGFYYQLVLTKAFYNLLDQQALSFFRPAKRLISIIFPYLFETVEGGDYMAVHPGLLWTVVHLEHFACHV